MRCRCRLIIAVTAIAGLSVAAQTTTAQVPVAAGRIAMVPVMGYTMRVRTEGITDRQPGEPVIVLEGGAVQSIETWDPIFDRVATLAPVIAYDRRGIGRSEFDGTPQTLVHVNESLHALLAAATVPPPYVLVGHSYGGVLISAFASRYPTEIAGLVYLDAPNTDLTVADLDTVSPDALRLLKSELDGFPADLPAGMQAELENIRRLMNDFTELNATHPPVGIPTAVLVAAGKVDQVPDPVGRSIRSGILGIQIRHQQQWALSSPQGLFVVTRRGGHNIHQDNPDLTVQAIHHILAMATAK